MEEEPAQRKTEKRIGNYIIEKTLGKGTFGKVKLATHTITGEKVAIKILQKDKIVDVADVQRVSRQIHILKLIRHPNIIQLYEIIQSPKYLFLVMEYMEKGQLFDYIVNKKHLNESQACKIFEQIVSGIQYSHKLRIVHRDLKLENILMDYDKTIRIVDFGLSNTYKPEERLKTACGSPCYAAPEMIESKTPYEPLMVDIWSAGVILYAMVCGRLPFEDQDTPKLYKKILSGDYQLPRNLSRELQDFISRVLTVNPNERIRVSEMKAHPWWNKYSDHYYPEGLVVGYHKIPIQPQIFKELKVLNLDTDFTEKCIEANRHNNETTTYFLLLKKYLKEGNISKADFSSKHFDKGAIQPNQRRVKNHSLKPEDLIKKSVSPSHKKLKVKSFYQDKNDDSFIHKSEKYYHKKSSRSKSINPTNKTTLNHTYNKHSKSKNHKSILHDRLNQTKHTFASKPMSRSSSKRKKNNLKDMSMAEDIPRPKGRTSSTTKNKKSHQGSFMIGGNGEDWPLEPKWKDNSKGRGAFRRR